ncbi:MAG TPA: 3-phosphoshikimate 1-carboxyvinyltransferase, partial [Anaerolineales bacterium]
MTVPGDKSISHRALMHAALAQGTSRLSGCLQAGVTQAMIDCLGQLGIEIENDRDQSVLVHGGKFRSPAARLNCGNSGATIRMLLGALAAQRAVVATLGGSAGLEQRPIKRVTDPLRLMGADIEGDTAPLTLRGRPLHGIQYTLPVASAQIKAAVLLAALQADQPTTLHEPGPSRDHSERLLRSLGVPLATHGYRLTVQPVASVPSFDLSIPGDLSSAAGLLAAAVLTSGSNLTIQAVGVNPTRTGILDALIAMGAEVEVANEREVGNEPVAEVTIRHSELRGIVIEGDWVVRMIDEFPLLAVLATQARGETIVRDAGELRVKESDRIGALVGELRRLGAHIEEQPAGFTIEGPSPLRGEVVNSHGDHRLAMALVVAGLAAAGETTILQAEAYHESFPN